MAICSIDGCEKEVVAKGFCRNHYYRFKKHGDPLKVSRVALHGMGLRERFECQAVKRDGCWDWTGHKDSRGYCRIMVDGKIRLAHRISWELHNGAIPNGMVVMHSCDNPTCTNPSHLKLGTQHDNLDDMREKGRDSPVRVRPSPGCSNPSAKLSDDDVRLIMSSDMGPSKLSEYFGISRSQIWNIRNGKSWKHLQKE